MKIDIKFATDAITNAINALDETDIDLRSMCVKLIATSSYLVGVIEGLAEDEI